jgi:hypothetical protein
VRYDHFATQQITPIQPSAASNSLLRSLLSPTASQDMLLYSRPGAWADIVLTKNVNTENNVDIVLDSVRLKVNYDFTRRPAGQATLKIGPSVAGFMPYFTLNRTDLDTRQDGRGTVYRSFGTSGTVTVEAQPVYGAYLFQKWTDGYGGDLPGGAGATANSRRTGGLAAAAAWTNPLVSLNVSTHRTIRAKYVNLTLAGNPSPANGAANVPTGVTLSWGEIPDATSYDLYLWPTGSAQPGVPTAAGLTVSRYVSAALLNATAPYSWQVVVHADQLAQPGPVWTFRTAGPQSMVRDAARYE